MREALRVVRHGDGLPLRMETDQGELDGRVALEVWRSTERPIGLALVRREPLLPTTAQSGGF